MFISPPKRNDLRPGLPPISPGASGLEVGRLAEGGADEAPGRSDPLAQP